MAQEPPKIAFILASTDRGTMIVNRLDQATGAGGASYGVGLSLLTHGVYNEEETALSLKLLDLRRKHFGDGVNVLDIGANIGAFTIPWSKHMTGWGHVLGFEAQERIFYALAGNIAVNNCFNARCLHAAVTNTDGEMRMPVPNYRLPGSFGSLELRQGVRNEFIGQPVDYEESRMTTVPAVSIDSMNLARLDLMKVDVEGMEMEVLDGARRTIARHHPILVVEKLKIDRTALLRFLDSLGYLYFASGLNMVAVHPSDPSREIGRPPGN